MYPSSAGTTDMGGSTMSQTTGHVQITAQPGPEAQNPWPWSGSGCKRPPQLGEEAVGHAEGQNGTATSSPSQVW
jgi:hypothetical protein